MKFIDKHDHLHTDGFKHQHDAPAALIKAGYSCQIVYVYSNVRVYTAQCGVILWIDRAITTVLGVQPYII